jgi:hypothetical protein
LWVSAERNSTAEALSDHRVAVTAKAADSMDVLLSMGMGVSFVG